MSRISLLAAEKAKKILIDYKRNVYAHVEEWDENSYLEKKIAKAIQYGIDTIKHTRWHQFKRLLRSDTSKQRLIELMEIIEKAPE